MQEDFKCPSAELKLLSSVSLHSFSILLENSVICSVICTPEIRYLYIRSNFFFCWGFFGYWFGFFSFVGFGGFLVFLFFNIHVSLLQL